MFGRVFVLEIHRLGRLSERQLRLIIASHENAVVTRKNGAII